MIRLTAEKQFEFILAVLYGPNRDEPNFYSRLKSKLLETAELPIVICGDWNLVQNFQMDTFEYSKENNIKAKIKVEEIKHVLQLCDPWRLNNPSEKKYSWFSSKAPKQMARLDFYLVTPDILSNLLKTEILHGYRTDHSFISICLKTNIIERGKGCWKLNTSLLYDKVYVDLVKKEITDTVSMYQCEGNTIDPQLLFEMIKLNIRGKTISYSSYKAKCKRQKEQSLDIKINKLKEILVLNLQGGSPRPHVISGIESDLKVLTKELETLQEEQVKAMIFRSRVKYYEEGEKPTKYFCNLEKKNYAQKTISKLNINGELIYEKDHILGEMRKFYQEL